MCVTLCLFTNAIPANFPLNSSTDYRIWFTGFSLLALAYMSLKQVFIEPDLRTNRPKWRVQNSDPPDEKIYEPEGVGIMLKKGDEVWYTFSLNWPFMYSPDSNGVVPTYSGSSIQYGVYSGSCFWSAHFKIARERWSFFGVQVLYKEWRQNTNGWSHW